MIFKQIFRIITWPYRRAGRIFRVGAKETHSAASVSVKSGAGAMAKQIPDNLLEAEYREEPPTGIEAALFKQLPRPRLTEQNASDLTLDQASAYAQDAKSFYRFNFPLFARGDFFYEEVEEDYLNESLGSEEKSIDRRFLDVTTMFRLVLNTNTRRMLLYWTPALFAMSFGTAFLMDQLGFSVALLDQFSVQGGIYIVASVIGLALAFLMYSWPYKVVQQRNLMNLDNYTTSKFARINHNFQVAKRRALNVERDKRMGQRNELKDEAGAWTLSYHWFAMRLMLCELVIRNKFYQVRRNTTLYWVGGALVTIGLFASSLWVIWRGGATMALIGTFATAGVTYILLTAIIMRRASAMMFGVLAANEWSRFNLIELDTTIRDHVGEDKLQIVTFRDRNRFE